MPAVQALTVAVAGQRQPIERVLDVAVYAPVGLALTLCDRLPDLHQRRQAIENRVRFAKFVGELAVRYGKADFERRLAERQAADAALRPDHEQPDHEQPDHEQPDHEQPDHAAPVTAEPMAPPVASVGRLADRRAGQHAGQPREAPAADSLPIGNYESLAAIHVVERLSSLRPDEIEQIRRFESSHRARRTILAKIGQLQDAGT